MGHLAGCLLALNVDLDPFQGLMGLQIAVSLLIVVWAAGSFIWAFAAAFPLDRGSYYEGLLFTETIEMPEKKRKKKNLEHDCPELEFAFNSLMNAFDNYSDMKTPENLDDLTDEIVRLREVGSLVLSGEPVKERDDEQ
jgi:hypothetical protein